MIFMNKQSMAALAAIGTLALSACAELNQIQQASEAYQEGGVTESRPRAQRQATGVTATGATATALPQAPNGAAQPASGSRVAHHASVLTTSQGQTLYVHGADGLNRASCRNECAQHFAPYIPMTGAQNGRQYAFFMRDDGVTQWSLQGQPLYVYKGDLAPGQRNGEGLFNMSTVAYPTLGAVWTPEYAPMFPNGVQNLPMIGSGSK